MTNAFLHSLLSCRLSGVVVARVHGVHSKPHSSGACWDPVLCLQSWIICVWPKPSGPRCDFQIWPVLCLIHGNQWKMGRGEYQRLNTFQFMKLVCVQLVFCILVLFIIHAIVMPMRPIWDYSPILLGSDHNVVRDRPCPYPANAWGV